jgi:hypothetical protein
MKTQNRTEQHRRHPATLITESLQGCQAGRQAEGIQASVKKGITGNQEGEHGEQSSAADITRNQRVVMIQYLQTETHHETFITMSQNNVAQYNASCSVFVDYQICIKKHVSFMTSSRLW